MEPITTNRALRAPWKEPCWLISEVPPSTRQSPWLYQHPRLGFLQYRNNLLHSNPFLLHAKLLYSRVSSPKTNTAAGYIFAEPITGLPDLNQLNLVGKLASKEVCSGKQGHAFSHRTALLIHGW
jgi:hypothetical protein